MTNGEKLGFVSIAVALFLAAQFGNGDRAIEVALDMLSHLLLWGGIFIFMFSGNDDDS